MGDAQVTFLIYAHSRPGVLAKIASIFYRRGLNIRALTVRPAREPELARIVIHVAGAAPQLERLVPSIGNLVDVLTVKIRGCDPHGGRSAATPGAEGRGS